MYENRKKILSDIEKERGSKAILYVTGDRAGLGTQIHEEVIDMFADHLDSIGVQKVISLIIYTRGGHTLTAWNLVNLIRQFCDELEIIIPSKCHSAGTIMCLGADRIIMTKQATLGPIDPSLNTPINPPMDGLPLTQRYPVSVEAIQGYLEFVSTSGIKNEQEMTKILLSLSEKVHPLVLGQIHRSRSQIQMLARRLLKNQLSDEDDIQKIISFLCSDSGSHDYTINRREAKDDLALNIEKPSPGFYPIIKSLYDNFREELELGRPFDPRTLLNGQPNADLRACRGLIESIDHGSHSFVTEGTVIANHQAAVPQLPAGMMPNAQLHVQFEGWRYNR